MRSRSRGWLCFAGLVLVLVDIIVVAGSAGASDPTPVWTQLSPSPSPSARDAGSMVYDSSTGNLVLFGGETDVTNSSNPCQTQGETTGCPSDTWEWSGTQWSAETPATSPPGRVSPAMAYDAATGDVVLFGGDDHATLLADTWLYNGTTWTEPSSKSSPSGRWYASMAYDAATGDVVLFGGMNSSGVFLNDTWLWNGSTWTQATPSDSPPARGRAQMGYDPSTGEVVLFGGGNNSEILGDTWAWNGTTWTELSPATSPPAQTAGNLDFDQQIGLLVLTASSNSALWSWNGSTWTQETTPPTSPPLTIAAYVAYDPSSDSMVDFGGYSPTDGDLSDTWTLTYPAMATGLTTSLSGDGTSGATISVPPNTAVIDTATLSGSNAPVAAGTVSYTVYSDSACTDSVASAGTVTVTDGAVPASTPVSLATPGTYYWQASYSGDSFNEASVSPCGSETETVSSPCGGDHLAISPTSGPPGTQVTICGDGWNPSSAIKVKYKTGKKYPRVGAYVICTTTVASDGDFSCSGTIPSGHKAGKTGSHVIKARQKSPKVKMTTTFTLT